MSEMSQANLQGEQLEEWERQGPTRTRISPFGRAMITLLFVLGAINFADKAVLGLAAVPIIKELHLGPAQYGMVSGSLFWLFSLSSVLVTSWADVAGTKKILALLIPGTIFLYLTVSIPSTLGAVTFFILAATAGAGIPLLVAVVLDVTPQVYPVFFKVDCSGHRYVVRFYRPFRDRGDGPGGSGIAKCVLGGRPASPGRWRGSHSIREAR